MRILFCGDVVGRSGRKTIDQYIPELRKSLGLDCVIVNGENAASGFGITKKICDQFLKSGADVVTAGDHCFDQKEVLDFIKDYPMMIRPGNLSKTLPGKGYYCFTTAQGKRVLIIHLLGEVFIKRSPDYNPFIFVEEILERYELGRNVDAIAVDFHAEATSEAMAMGHHLDGRVSFVTGSHTHVPTADHHIMIGGTGFQTDAGMCGDYNSVIGFNKHISLEGFIHKTRSERLTTANSEGTLCGLYVELDDKTGMTNRIHPVRVGGKLQPTMPEVML